MRTGYVIASMLEWLYRKGEVINPHLPMHGLACWLLTYSRKVKKKELLKLWALPLGKQSYSFGDDLSKRDSLMEKQGMLHSAWQAQLFRLGDKLRWRWHSIWCRRVAKPLQMKWWKRGQNAEDQDIPKGRVRPTIPLLQHETLKSVCKA